MQMLLKNRRIPIARLVALLPYLACIVIGVAIGPLWQFLSALLSG